MATKMGATTFARGGGGNRAIQAPVDLGLASEHDPGE